MGARLRVASIDPLAPEIECRNRQQRRCGRADHALACVAGKKALERRDSTWLRNEPDYAQSDSGIRRPERWESHTQRCAGPLRARSRSANLPGGRSREYGLLVSRFRSGRILGLRPMACAIGFYEFRDIEYRQVSAAPASRRS